MSVWGNPVALGGGGGSANIQALSVTQNGTYTASGGVDGYSPVTVAVPGGGGGSTNVLSGASAPSVAQGSNRDMYLQYADVGSFPAGITPKKSIITAGGNRNNGFRSDFLLSSTTQIVMSCKIHSTVYANWQGLIAERNTTPVFGFYSRMNGSNVFGVEYGNTTSGPPASSTTGIYDKDIEITIDGTGASWTDGSATYSVNPTMPLPTGGNLYFFGTDFTSATSNEAPQCTVYRILVIDNGVTTHDYRPAQDSNNVVCLYDLVNDDCTYPDNGVWISGGDIDPGEILSTYAKVSGIWQPLVGTNISDINLGGGEIKGFELAFANGDGGTQTGGLLLDNSYFVCYFDDNMSSTYTLNGVSRTMSVVASGNQQTLADTLEVTNPQVQPLNAMLALAGSAFTFYHGDSGSYCSIVGGWTGYPTGGTIYKQSTYGTQNAVTLAEAHGTLLVFIGACGSLSSYNTVSVNGISYTVTNIGNHYGQVAIYGAIELEGNTDTTVTVELPVSCYSFVSVVGLD